MKIKVELNQKSIKEAIKQLEAQKKVLTDVAIPEYLNKSAEWIRERANTILSLADIGDDVKSKISSRWDIKKISSNHIVLFNSYYKAAYVEFGVGIIGQTSKHPNADVAGYEYNVESEHKFGQGYWRFEVSDVSRIDIPEKAIIYQSQEEDGLSIVTQGTEGVWYLFNAVEDFKVIAQKSIWEEIKKKYWS